MAVRVFTTPVVLTEPMELAVYIESVSGVDDFVFDNSNISYPEITAAAYPAYIPLPLFAAQASSLIRTWIRAVALDLGLDTVPAVADILFKIVFPETLSGAVDANRFSITFDPTGFAKSGTPIKLQTLDLGNASGWCTVLGLRREATTGFFSGASIENNVATVAGVRQPPSLFVFERSDFDEGEREIYPTFTTRALKDGSVRTHVQDASKAERTIRLLTGDGNMLGGPLPVGTFSQYSSSGSVLELYAIDEAGIENASGLTQSPELILPGYYYRVGLSRHVARADVVTGDPPTSLTLFENAPDTPVAGQIVYRISEAEAMLRKAIETGYLLVHEPDDFTGGTRWLGVPYALNFDGEAELFPPRVGDFFDLFDLEIPLLRRDLPEMELP